MSFFQCGLLGIGIIIIVLLCGLFYYVTKFIKNEENRGEEKD